MQQSRVILVECIVRKVDLGRSSLYVCIERKAAVASPSDLSSRVQGQTLLPTRTYGVNALGDASGVASG